MKKKSYEWKGNGRDGEGKSEGKGKEKGKITENGGSKRVGKIFAAQENTKFGAEEDFTTHYKDRPALRV